MQVFTVNWTSHWQALRQIRQQVFIEEQHVSREDEWDNRDELESTQHFLVVDEAFDDAAIATARILPNGKIGRMAVLPEYRHRGTGRRLLQAVVQYAVRREMHDLYVHAQQQAIPFYQKCGFTCNGPEFNEAGIPHIKMLFSLADNTAAEYLYGDQVLRLTELNGFVTHMQHVTKVAIRTIDILSNHLAKEIFDDAQFVETLSQLARRSPNSAVRILLRDSQPLQGISHGLVNLSQRISSRVTIRTLAEQPQNPDKAYLISDRKRLVYFNDESTLVGFANYSAAAEAMHELDEFDNLWERHSSADPNLARLYI